MKVHAVYAGRGMPLAKLVGAFLIVAAVLLFVRSGAQMFDSWESAKSANECFAAANTSMSLDDKMFCQNQAALAGLFVRLGQKELSAKQFWIILLEPIGWLFLWAVVFVVGLVIYACGCRCRVPAEKPKGRFAVKRSRKRH